MPGINESVNREILDIEGIKRLLKKECETCNMNLKRDENMICDGCPFIFNSSTTTKNGEVRTKVSLSEIFTNYGITNPSSLGKCHLFRFLNNPEDNWMLGGGSEIPDVSLFGKEKNPNWTWHLHHINGNHWDDRKINLLWVVNTDHQSLHNLMKKHTSRSSK